MAPSGNKPRVVVVIGPPGCGKGTLGQGITAVNAAYIHMSTGDICRAEVERKTELGRCLEGYLPHRLVPDRIIIAAIIDRLSRRDVAGKTVLLDGFPRTRNQALQLIQAFSVDRLVLLQASDDLCVQRILERRIDPVTSEVYNLRSAKPPTAVASRLVVRPMDKDTETIRGRLQRFHAMLASILGVFKGKIFAVNSAQASRYVIDAVADVLETPLPTPVPEARQADAAKPTVIIKDKKGECVICRDQPADYLVTPCGHQCGCGSCLETLRSHGHPCPICRTKVHGIVHVFQSGYVNAEGGGEATADEDDAAAEDAGEFTADDILGTGWDESNAVMTNPQAPTSDIAVSIAPCEAWGSKNGRVAVTVAVPDAIPILPVDVCCVIDISGSMGMEATFQDPKNDAKTISSGMSQLDLVKHSVKTIIHTLTAQDSLSITAFHTQGHAALPATRMDSAGMARAVTALEALEPRNATNIWAGLETGLDSLRNAKIGGGNAGPRNKFLVFLTDGKPTDSPPDCEVSTLAHYKEQHPDFKCMISTFGFGYELKSKLLLGIAHEGGGTFGFIPDAKILGTCFVNAVANARTCLCLDSKVHLTAKNGCNIVGDHPVVDDTMPWRAVSWGTVAHLGPLHAGQSRDLVVQLGKMDKLAGAEFLDVTLEFVDPTGTVRKVKGVGSTRATPSQAAISANARSSTCVALAKVIDQCDANDGRTASVGLKVLQGQLIAFEALTHNPSIRGLLEDVNGRISKAMSTTERFNRWGAHYLRALYRSHQLQMKTNFMDAGLQVYGGSQFNALVEVGGKAFLTLPMLKSIQAPSRTHRTSVAAAQPRRTNTHNTTTTTATRRTPPPVVSRTPTPPPDEDNETYYGGSGGGCFAASCEVLTEQSTAKCIRDVRPGEQLRMADGTCLRVALVVELRHPRADLVTLEESGLTITPNHPIRALPEAPWARASAIPGAVMAQCAKSVFNFVFDQRPTCGLIVNGVECVTYYHDVPELHHKFYSTEAIMRALRSQPGFAEGRVCVRAPTIKPRPRNKTL